MENKKLYIGVEHIQQDGEPLINIARWVEFGTETAPPRPAFRMGTEKAIKNNNKLIKAQLSNIAKAGLRGKLNESLIDRHQEVMLTQIGRSSVKEIKSIIKNGETAPNAPATIKKKGFDHPWFETGTVLENVSYLVEK